MDTHTFTHALTCTRFLKTNTNTVTQCTHTHSHRHKENRSGIFLEQEERRMRSYSWASDVSGVDSSVDRW